MHQITALYQDCEIAHAEGDNFEDTLNEVCDQISDSTYSVLEPEDIQLSCINDGVVMLCSASTFW